MPFHQDITALKDHIDNLKTIEELRAFLLEKKLNLVVTITSHEITCVDWNITEKQVAGVLELEMHVRISNADFLLEIKFPKPVLLDEIDAINQEDLFETLKQGIKNCIQGI